ncbi:sugar transferase [Pseudotenacibaculum haliotis]|uniref:Sugar transferase n=1 Tax=Pseudotenacibaculum haliotis TaxID=1862138 RepID=A0ABW5LWC5_9FLAO
MGVLAIKKKNKSNSMINEFDFITALKDCEKTQDEISQLILKEVDNNYEVLNFIKKYFDFCLETNYFTSTSTQFNIEKLNDNKYSSIINLKKVNDARYINKFFETINSRLPNSGLYFGKVETYPNRRKAILNKYPPIINRVVYITDMIFTRIFPKLFITKKIYFYLTKGKGRVVSRAETYGRLYSCGFEIVDEKSINNYLYFVAKKVKEPSFDTDPTYGPIIKLKRVGKNGEKFNVYKLRTMHPFSEYLQEYVYKKNNLQEGGKIKDDFRISPEGRVLRKFWIDELPMLVNILKGDMKIVGVRPLSPHFYSLYDKELQEKRIQNKPGFIPPFYVDLPKTMDEIMDSEKKYLDAYKKAPFKTDLKYFFLAFKNVLFRGARSN